MKVTACVNDACYEIELRVDPKREGHYIALIGGREVRLESLERKAGSITLAIDDRIGFYEFHHEKGRLSEIVHANRTYRGWVKDSQQEQLESLLAEWGAGAGGSATETKLCAPMPGKILGVSVKVGDKIELGQVVMVLEAMKMENEISSTVEGKIKFIAVKTGDSVNNGDALLEVELPG
jgi:biotin carboxyl carrier protein